jgi:hypothetical protein
MAIGTKLINRFTVDDILTAWVIIAGIKGFSIA